MTDFSKTLLCIDSESFEHPELIGLADENLAAQPWLRVFSNAQDARMALNNDSELGAAWVVSTDDMEGINLAAALKNDRADCDIQLISFGGTGSEVGRCQAAGINLLRGRDEFIRRYSEKKGAAVLGPGSTERAEGAEKLAQNTMLKEEPHGEMAFLDAEPDLESIRLEGEPCASGKEVDSKAVRSMGESGWVGNDSLAGGLDAVVPKRSASKSAQPVSSGSTEPSQEELISRVVFQPVQTDKTAYVVSVVGGNGGVGKSTVASCAATMLQGRGLKTLLVDADLQFGDMGFLLGKEDAFDIADLMAQPERLAQLEPKDGLPALICSPRKLEQSELIMNRIAELIDYLKGFFDVIVVNTGAFWSESHVQIIEASDKVLFMLDQRPSSVRSCSHALELCARCGIATQQFQYVLNFCSRHALLTSLDVSCALQGAHVEELKDGGKEVGELLGAGLPLELLASKNVFIDSLGKLMGQILPEALTAVGQDVAIQLAPKKRYVFGGFRKRRAACL